jgi:5-methyltetrahydrofolate--homocysteine methyltransferase
MSYRGEEPMDVLQKISEELQKGNFEQLPGFVQEALDAGIPPSRILKDGLVVGMSAVGEQFQNDEIFLPDVLISAKAMQAAMTVLRPKLMEAGVKLAGKIVMGTVKGDIHDIGKNLVAMLLEGAGFQVIDLGIDVSPEKFVEAVKSSKADVVGLSALLTITMPLMKEVVESLQESGIRNTVKVLVGGAPVTEQFAKEIGADGYAPDAHTAVEQVRELVG